MLSSVIVQWWCRHLLIGPPLRILDRPKVTGREHIPRRGPVIIVANHLAVSDSFHLGMAARRPLFFLAKSDYFDGSGARGALSRWFFTALGQIPVDRSGGAGATPALDAAEGILAAGGAWAIHPEGTRSPDGRVHRGRTGAVRVAVTTGAPMVPVVITGTDETRHRWWHRRRVTVTALPPLTFTAEMSADDVRSATDTLMRTIADRCGVDYVDRYARPGERNELRVPPTAS